MSVWSLIIVGSMFRVMHAYRARTEAGVHLPLVLRAHRYVMQVVTGVVSCVVNAVMRIVRICCNPCTNGSTAITLFLLAFLAVSSTARLHQHLGTSTTESDVGLPDHLGQHRECIVCPH